MDPMTGHLVPRRPNLPRRAGVSMLGRVLTAAALAAATSSCAGAAAPPPAAAPAAIEPSGARSAPVAGRSLEADFLRSGAPIYTEPVDGWACRISADNCRAAQDTTSTPTPTSSSTSVTQVWVQCELGNHYRVYVQPRPNNLHTFTAWTPKPDVRIRSGDSAGVCPAFDGS